MQDNGTGFPEHILKRAFEPYVTTKAKGTGLGLAVVKKIADEHGARIDLKNRVEDGRCREPKCRYHSQLRHSNSSLRAGPQGSQSAESNMANILVVDDELGIRDLLSEILNDEGHNVELAENAAQARAARSRSRPDLVLLDIWMPDTDGVTLLKEWSTTGLLSMPVIMMSGHATIETAVEATKIGAHRSWKSRSPCRSCSRPSKRAWRATAPRRAAQARRRPARLPPPVVELTVRSRDDRRPDLPAGRRAWARRRARLFELDKPLRDARDEFEKCYFEFHLAKEGGSMTRVAEKTGLERTHLYRKLKQLGVDLSRGKRERQAGYIISGSRPGSSVGRAAD